MSQYRKLPLQQERELMALAQQDAVEARNRLLLHLIGFFIFRVRTTAFSSVLAAYGEDIVQDCVVLAVDKMKTYNLHYRNGSGELQPRHFSTYIWKSITGLIYSYGKKRKEICFSDLPDSIAKNY